MAAKVSHLALVQPELDAIRCRLVSVWGREWRTIDRTTVSSVLELATYDGVAGADAIVHELVETATRDGDWYDGVLIEYTAPGGSVSYQASGGGANTRGLVVARSQAAPALNAAQLMRERTVTRGYEIEIIARPRFDVDAYATLVVHAPDTVRTARVRSLEWNIAESTMKIVAQAGESES